MSKIPFSRLLVYLILLTALPLVVIGVRYTKEKKQLQEVMNSISHISYLGHVNRERQSTNMSLRKIHEQVDPNYITKLEELTFLKKEKEALEALFASRCFTGNESAEKRHAFITGDQNVLLFAEQDVQSNETICETLETVIHPVEIDHTDLRKILDLIEEKQQLQPQLLITDLKLSKQAKADGNEIFELNCSFIKREFEK